MQEKRLQERLWARAELCGATIELAGQKLEPDETKAYVEFRLAHGYTKVSRVKTAYGTSFHPGTVANSYGSLHHQVFDLGHKIRAYDATKEKNEIPRDYSLGTVVGVEFPPIPGGQQSWSILMEAKPAIRGAAVIHKQLEKVPQVLGEHLSGRHNWTVSMEVDYSLLQSGFMVEPGPSGKFTREQDKLLKETSPREFAELGLGYVELTAAPDVLLECWDFNRNRMKAADKGGTWEGAPVTMFKGGLNGQVHFKGVGLVRYGAEREAQVQQILASDPDRLLEEEWTQEGIEAFRAWLAAWRP